MTGWNRYIFISSLVLLPSTRALFWQKVLKVNFTATQSRSSHVVRRRSMDGIGINKMVMVMTIMIQVQESVFELSICGCTTGCKTLLRKCKKSKFVCTEMCLCNFCEIVEEDGYLAKFIQYMLHISSFYHQSLHYFLASSYFLALHVVSWKWQKSCFS